uniref:ATPase n=1 Tax=Geobacter metallireducens TaxID=28232 RepID=A0A831UGV9_GEOME
MKRVVFLTPPDVRHGFSMAGVVHHTVAPEELEPLLRQLLADPDTGVVVVEERLLEGIDEERFREMERRWFGILLTLPVPRREKMEGEEDYLERLIRRAIGYHVRLQP